MEENGFECHLSPLLDEADDKLIYGPGNYWKKFLLLISQSHKRQLDLEKIDQYDLVFIFREALMTRSIYYERQFAKSGVKLIYDFDDAIWKNDTSRANRLFSWVKNPAKINKIMALCDVVFAGNQYLAEYASQFNNQVAVIPTTIDTDEYVRVPKSPGGPVVIGWSGSLTTIKHFELAIPFLRILKEKYGDRIEIKVIGDSNYINEELGIRGLAWKKEDEVKELSTFDIGIMPLVDDAWSRGKCGLKGLQYMALEIPTLMSPVGVNKDIIHQGMNGFLPKNTQNWVEQISLLIENSAERKKVGRAARETVISKYSVHTQKENYLMWMKKLTDKGE
ncbi:MAG: glycosyltransferase family 4 protein [Flavobacteriales bacterium]